MILDIRLFYMCVKIYLKNKDIFKGEVYSNKISLKFGFFLIDM